MYKCVLLVLSSELREEMRPETLADVSEVTKFDASKLKHVETKESNVLPSKEGNEHPVCSYKKI